MYPTRFLTPDERRPTSDCRRETPRLPYRRPAPDCATHSWHCGRIPSYSACGPHKPADIKDVLLGDLVRGTTTPSPPATALTTVLFLNLGYEEDPPMALPLSASDEPNRFRIQLYHGTATQVDLIAGKRVLEVSCGHGGGASYIMRTLHPASYTGLDLNPAGIDFCRERHSLPGLGFVQGDAEKLPFDDQSFDAVINVESSHQLPVTFRDSSPKWHACLRPGGHFLYTDSRRATVIAAWEAALADAPMRMLSHAVHQCGRYTRPE